MKSFKQLILTIIILTITISCNTTTKDKKNNANLDTKQLFDTSKYINIYTKTPYLDTINYSKCTVSYTGRPDSFETDVPAFFLDTFSQNENKFRLVYQMLDSNNDATLEKLINGQWFRRIEFYKFNNSGEIVHSIDINNDGYKDITREAHFFKYVYFFDKAKNNFIDTFGAYINDGIILLDTTQNIYCDIQEFRGMCGNIHSQLYTFTNFKRINLFDLELYNCTSNGASILTKLILSKCYDRHRPNEKYFDSLVNFETTKLPKPINLDKDYEPRYSYFDYVSFWKKNYKRLMGYSQH